MSRGRVVHVRDHVEGAVYIGRAMPRFGLPASPWRNPYKIGTHGTRADCLLMYADDLAIHRRDLARLPPLLPGTARARKIIELGDGTHERG
jgi:hypothetical protein